VPHSQKNEGQSIATDEKNKARLQSRGNIADRVGKQKSFSSKEALFHGIGNH